ncbi:putative CBF/NF-Y family transcription factor [Aspergillus affinis]|uniref:putative CBF/NF-Y family transcription factor n=1 Tax=Aspergillus affinis TaxID=1070780 RepID=UPI0022FDB2CA|nr:histone-fold-containing protein [Aspergillus affinis]KAI9041630.1 histone-fold-containing protein [Aspergillus affinis]
MPRKSTSSTPGDLEDTQTQTHTQSPDLPDQSPSQPAPQSVQATEQQLKARAEGVSIEDYLLPRSLTLRLAKSVLPPNTSLQKDAVLAIQKAATVFVSYLSSHANEATLKRTLSPADVFNALSELELEGFRPRLEKELDAFTDLKAGKRKSKGNSSANTNNTGAAAAAAATADGDVDGGVDVGKEGSAGVVEGGNEGPGSASVARGAKRVKRDGLGNGNGVRGDNDNDEDEEGDGDETQDEPEKVDENETEVDEEEEEEEDEDEDEVPEEEEDPDRVEDLDRDSRAKRTMDPDAAGDDDTESEDENGPGSQLRGDLGLG